MFCGLCFFVSSYFVLPLQRNIIYRISSFGLPGGKGIKKKLHRPDFNLASAVDRAGIRHAKKSYVGTTNIHCTQAPWHAQVCYLTSPVPRSGRVHSTLRARGQYNANVNSGLCQQCDRGDRDAQGD